MPFNKINTGNAIRGRVIPNAAQRNDCQAVILKLDFSDLGHGAGTLHTVGTARLDMQGRTPEGVAYIQVNQIGTGTVAAVMIANSVQRTEDTNNQSGARNGAISVLNQSLDTGTVWNLTGSLP